MSKSDLKARPVYRHSKDSIQAHPTIVFAALAVPRWPEATTGVTTRGLVKTLHRYRTIDIQAGDIIVTAEDPIPDDAPGLSSKAPPGVLAGEDGRLRPGRTARSASGDPIVD